MIIGTAGHIDHGKTALVKALTGVDADRLPEEKRRGITIDLGFAPLVLDRTGVVGVIDVPGHEDFVRSMVVGASGIDLGLVVIASDDGVMPQTREHLSILELLGIPRIVVALTKSDLTDEEWRALVTNDVEALLLSTDYAGAPIVPCSSKTGAGLSDLRATLDEQLAATRSRAAGDLFRLPIDRAFSVRGTGTVVTGTVWSGHGGIDEPLRILPAGITTRARRIEQHGQPVAQAIAGNRAAVALSGIEVDDAGRGSVLVSDPHWRPTSMFEAVIDLESQPAAAVTPRTWLRLHAGASEVGARITFSPEVAGEASSIARVTTDAPIVVRAGDRFVLRLPAPLRTVGGGIIIDPYARRRSLPQLQSAAIAALKADAVARLTFLLASEGNQGISLTDVPVRIGCTPAEVRDCAEAANAIRGRHNLFSRVAVEQVMASVTRIVAEYEIKAPLSLGVPAQTVRESVRANEELADISIRELTRAGQIEAHGPLLRRFGWVPTPSDQDLEASGRLAHDICAGDREPPSVGELISRYGGSVPALLRFLERQGRIVQVEADRYYGRQVLDDMIASLKGNLVPGTVYIPAQLRDVLGFSRKYLIPFLEYCDRSGITERRGEGRVLRETPGVLLDTSPAHS